jgi:hypothetical protein
MVGKPVRNRLGLLLACGFLRGRRAMVVRTMTVATTRSSLPEDNCESVRGAVV